MQAIHGWVRVRRREGHGTVAHCGLRGGGGLHIDNGEKQEAQVIPSTRKCKVLRVPFIWIDELRSALPENRRQHHVAAGVVSVGSEARMVLIICRADESEERVINDISPRHIKFVTYSSIVGLVTLYLYRRGKVGIV
jgi:hypothetical protein